MLSGPVLDRPRETNSLPQVQPDEAGPVLLHELAPLLVELLDSLLRLWSLLLHRSLTVRIFIARLATRLRPLGEPLLELRLAEPVGGGEQRRHVADQDVELAVGIDVVDPDPRVGSAAP